MPFKSQAQRRLFYAKARSGEISESKVREWERETPKGKKLPEKVAGIVPKKALVAAGALAVPYAVGRNVQKQQQQEQIVEKSAAFDIGVVDGMAKEALSPALRNKAMGMRMARTFREAGGKGGYWTSGLHPSNYTGPSVETAKSILNPSPAMRRYFQAGAKDMAAAHKAGGTPALLGERLNASIHQQRGWKQELAKKK
jgi:hypothetical protein